MRKVCLTLVALAAFTLAALVIDDGLQRTRLRSAVVMDAQSEPQRNPIRGPLTPEEPLHYLHSQPNDF